MTAAPISDALSDPIEITAHAWHHALNAAPPADHHNDSFGESFKTASGNAAAIYVRINERHVTFTGDASTPHHVCIRHALHVRPRRPHWPDDTAGKGHPR